MRDADGFSRQWDLLVRRARLQLRKGLRSAGARRLLRVYASQVTGLRLGIASAVLVGIAAGLGAVAFRWLIDNFSTLFFDGGRSVLGFMGEYYVILVPAAGGLLVGPLVYFFAREAKGHGVPEVMTAVKSHGGKIRPRVAVVKSLTSSICIGSGGSVGREGPIVQIGSAVGSTLGQWLRLPPESIRLLVACGAAGGISATFNAPLAGIFFSMEIILRRYTGRSFGLVALSSVVAAAIAHAFVGDASAFVIPQYQVVSGWEFPLYILLGLIAAFVAHAFVGILYKSEDLFEALRMPEYLKPVLGGLMLGSIAIFYPQLFGVGYETAENALLGNVALAVLLPLLVLKVVATSLTLGSGGSGGVFAPSLFIGAVLGAAFGSVAHTFMPGITAPEGAYALVAMGAVFAGAARAPVTAIVILFEMTRDYNIILPLIAAVVVSYVVARWLRRDSIYTLKMRRQGIPVPEDEEWNALRNIRVSDVMIPDYPTVRPETTLQELGELFVEHDRHAFPVVSDEGNMIGIVAISDLKEAQARRGVDLRTVANIATTDIVVAYPDQTLHEALAHFWGRDVGHLAVVSRENPRRFLGLVRRRHIVQAYADSIESRGYA